MDYAPKVSTHTLFLFLITVPQLILYTFMNTNCLTNLLNLSFCILTYLLFHFCNCSSIVQYCNSICEIGIRIAQIWKTVILTTGNLLIPLYRPNFSQIIKWQYFSIDHVLNAIFSLFKKLYCKINIIQRITKLYYFVLINWNIGNFNTSE